MIALALFVLGGLVLALLPVYVGCRVLRVGNPSWWAALLAVVAAVALQDLAFGYIDDDSLAWLASLLLAAFAFSLLLDTSYWRGLLIGSLVLAVQLVVTFTLLGGTPPTEVLDQRITAAQEELWPEYHN
ncbi:hypothetical protein [Ferrimonas balearica]|uniref:hypothetical protein n=1 Tax=Ferrimonas balearica TaxID=44012 RepID=UPI001C992A50|nr:hypothetical protein [Ferrimonas balearica]MBY5993879.1 hypothetical protein [Ferrimonas balearica]